MAGWGVLDFVYIYQSPTLDFSGSVLGGLACSSPLRPELTRLRARQLCLCPAGVQPCPCSTAALPQGSSDAL